MPLALILLSFAACRAPSKNTGPTVQVKDSPGDDMLPPVVYPGSGPNPNAVGSVQLTGSTCKAFPKPAVAGDGVMLTQVYAGLSPSQPLGMQQVPGDSSRWYMIEQGGRVSTFPNRNDVTEADRLTALDLSGQIYSTNEAGLLGFTIDPNFARTRAMYLSYTLPHNAADSNDTSVYSQLVRYQVSADGNTLTAPGSIIFSQFMYFDFHLGGNIAFGPDGYMYYGMGFGDTANDPAKFAQDTSTWRGKMLRIDVNNPNGSLAYSIPRDNPYANGSGGLPEIWALGLRNPWRWSFDAATGDLFLGDVGQDLYEEVDLIVRGGNYGWPVYEGNQANPNSASPSDSNAHYIMPLVTQTHSQNICVTGGYVYRGRAIPSLVGTYLFGDCLTGHVYALSQDGTTGAYQSRLLIENSAGVLTFAQDNDGEIYMLGRDGKINRLDPAGSAADANIPTTLSATGCTSPNDITAAAAGMLPYSVRVPFWSDGADKGRYLALPADGTLSIDANNHFVLPNGTVLVKHFAKNNKRVETRLFMRFDDGSWGGFTYAWNDAQTDATLVAEQGNTRVLDANTSWNYPSRTQCSTCHSAAPGYSLGWEVAQINTSVTFSDGSSGNQIDALVKYGLLATAPTGSLPQLPDWTDTTLSSETRARTYLHVNCGVCHQPGGLGLGAPNLLYTTPAGQLGVCNAPPTYGNFGVANATLLTPGSAAQSMLSYRMHATSSARMPQISSGVVDAAGTGVVDAWINGLKACP